MLNKTETKAVIKAFMNALMTNAYADIKLRKVADDAGVPLSKMLAQFSNKLAIVEGFADQINQEVLAGDDPDMVDEPVRERLFDVLMRRYDALLPYRLALIQLERDARRDPGLALGLASIARAAMTRMAASADVDVDGARGMVVLGGLLQLHAQVMRVWLKETDEGQALTMAELDKALRQAERRMADIDRTVLMMRGEGGPTGGPLCRLRARMGRSDQASDASAEAA